MAPVVHQTLHLGHPLVIIATQSPPDVEVPICHWMLLFDVHKDKTLCVADFEETFIFHLS